jgi:hypothetical protein
VPSLLLFSGAAASSLTVTGVALPGAAAGASVQIEKRGGTVIEITGTGFDSTAAIAVLDGGSPVGAGYFFDATFDVTATRIYAGMPALDPGTYDLQVTVGASMATLVGALEAVLFAEETKVHQARRGFAQPWATGPRILTNNVIDLGAL